MFSTIFPQVLVFQQDNKGDTLYDLEICKMILK